MVHGQAVVAIAGLALIAVLGAAKPASGAFGPLSDNALHPNSKYSLTHNANITLNYNATDVGSQQGTLTVTTTWGQGDFATRSILFEQTVEPGGDFQNSRGLRLQLVLNLGNNTGTAWIGFRVETIDNSVPDPVGGGIGGQGAHIHKAHFHGTPVLAGTGLTTFNNFNNTQIIDVSGGQHVSGANSVLGISGFLSHERNLTDGQDAAVKRTYTLELTPLIPEPATVSLLLLGSLVLRRRRRR